MKRERTTSVTRLRTVSDAAREGLITKSDKSTLKKLILCNDEKAEAAMEALTQNRVFELQEILTNLQSGVTGNSNASRMRVGSMNARAKTSSLDMGADSTDLLWSALDDLDVDGELGGDEAWKQAGEEVQMGSVGGANAFTPPSLMFQEQKEVRRREGGREEAGEGKGCVEATSLNWPIQPPPPSDYSLIVALADATAGKAGPGPFEHGHVLGRPAGRSACCVSPSIAAEEQRAHQLLCPTKVRRLP